MNLFTRNGVFLPSGTVRSGALPLLSFRLPLSDFFKLFLWFPLLFGLLFLLLTVMPARAEQQFLEPEQAFQFSASQVAPDRVAVTYHIADGYYMYRERFKFEAVGAVLGAPVFPAGTVHYDTTFEKNVETYRQSITVQIPVTASGSFTLIAQGQGCSEKGLCYAPMQSKKNFDGTVTALAGVVSEAGGGASAGSGSAIAGRLGQGADTLGDALKGLSKVDVEESNKKDS